MRHCAIVGRGVGFDVLCLLKVNNVIVSLKMYSSVLFMVILTVYVLYGAKGA